MTISLQTEAIPLESDECGTVRIAGSRVTLDVLASAWQAGETPEQIVDQFPTLRLADVYAVITWMLRHPSDLADYLARAGADAEQIRAQINKAVPQEGLRERLQARTRRSPRA
jgi:uncharacterized protein (DUF433 family)